MPKQRGAQSRETTLSRLVKEVAVMQELQVGGGGGGGGVVGAATGRVRAGPAACMRFRVCSVWERRCRRLGRPKKPPPEEEGNATRNKQTHTYTTNKRTHTQLQQHDNKHQQQQNRCKGCPSLVRLLACYEDDAEVQVVMELCGGGDLQQLSEVRTGLDWTVETWWTGLDWTGLVWSE